MMWNFNQFLHNIAIIDEAGHQSTYADLKNESEKLAKVFDRRCLVFNFCANQKGSLLGYLTLINHNIVPVMLETDLNKEFSSHLIATYKPDYLWVPQDVSNQFHYECVFSTWNYELLKTEFTNCYPLHEDLALLLTTSGSTGSPKLVRQSYQNILANTKSIVKYLELDEKERPITTLPMHYTYGLSILNTHLYVGASMILTEKTLMQKEFWQQFRDYQATSFGGVPYTYEMLDKLRFFRMELPHLRTMTQAGGKLSPELHKKFAEYALANNKRFFIMYGQTEATARMSYLPHEKALEKYGSMGIAIPDGEFSLIDEEGHLIHEAEIVGELIYKGENVTMGYAESGEDLIKEDLWKGILVTGDMARRDKDGFYYIVGRKKRFLKIFGSRINLDETERMIRATFSDLDCACGGTDDKMSVFITDESKKNDVLKFLAEKTGLNPVAFKMMFLEQIPRNESGKILYTALEAYL